MAKADLEAQKCLTPEFLVSFPYIFKPTAFKNQEPKYSVTMVFKKSVDLSPLKKIAHAAAATEFGPDPKKWPKFKYPLFRDGDKEKGDIEGYEDSIFVVAKSKKRPGLLDRNLEDIVNEEDFYPGCFARAQVIAYAYDNEFGKGVGLSLQHIQKLRDGKSLLGRKTASEVFNKVEDTSDDEASYSEPASEEATADSMFS